MRNHPIPFLRNRTFVLLLAALTIMTIVIVFG